MKKIIFSVLSFCFFCSRIHTQIVVQPTDTTIVCQGLSATLTVLDTFPGTKLYQWQKKIGLTWQNTGPDSPVFTQNYLGIDTLYRCIISNGGIPLDTTDNALVIVEPAPIALPGGPYFECLSVPGAIPVMGSTMGTVGSIYWSYSSPASLGFISGSVSSISTSFTPASYLSGSGTITLIAYGSGACAGTTSVASTPISWGAPPTVAFAGIDQTLCSTSVVTLSGNLPVIGTGTWTCTPPVLGFPTNAATPPPFTLPPGSYTFRWTISNPPCADSYDEVVITVMAPPTIANAGSDQTLCSSSLVSLSGNPPGVGTGMWTCTPTVLGFPTTASAPPSFPLAPGSYTFRWTISNAPCTDSFDETVITIKSPPTTANAGSDLTLCSSSSIAISGNTPTEGMGTWTSLPPVAGFPTTLSAPPSFTLAPGIYTFRWTISNAPCPVSFDETVITIKAPPSGAFAGPDQTVCSTSFITLSGSPPSVGSGLWTCTPPVLGFPTSASAPPPFSLAPGSYTFRWTISNAPCADSFDEAVITVKAPPTAANAGSDQTLCSSSPVLLSGNLPTVGTGIWTCIPPVAGFPTTASLPPPFTLSPGIYTFRWTISNAPCADSFDETVITIKAPPTSANAGSDQTLCSSSPVSLSGNPPIVGTGTWTCIPPVAGFPTSTATPAPFVLAPGIYTFRWTISNAPCSASFDETIITIKPPPTIANAGSDQTVCGSSTVALLGNTPTTGTGAWTCIPPVAGFPTSASAPPPFSLTPGIYTFRWTISNAPCADSFDEVVITVKAPPTTANAGPDQIICGTYSGMAGNTPISGSGIWSFAGGPVFPGIIYPLNPGTPVTGLTDPGVYSFFWTISNSPCSSSVDVMTITVVSPAAVANAGVDQKICGGTSAFLAGNDPFPGTGSWSMIAGGGVVTSTISPTTSVTGLSVGDNIFVWTTFHIPCDSTTDTVIIKVGEPPNALSAALIDTCSNFGIIPVYGLASGTFGSTDWTYFPVSGSGTITSGSTTLNPYFTPTSPAGSGIMQLLVQGTGGCLGVNDTSSTSIRWATPPVAVAGPDMAVCADSSGFSITTGADTMYSHSIEWFTAGGGILGSSTSLTSAIYFPDSSDIAVGSVSIGLIAFGDAPCSPDTSYKTIFINALPNVGFDYPDRTFCQNASNPIPMLEGTGGGVFTSDSGLAFVNPITGEIDLAASTTGSHLVTYSIPAIGACHPVADTMTIIILPQPGPVISTSAVNPCAGAFGVEYCIPPTTNHIVWTVTNGTITSGWGTECILVNWWSGPGCSVSVSENIWGDSTCKGTDLLTPVFSGTAPGMPAVVVKASDTLTHILVCISPTTFTQYRWWWEPITSSVPTYQCVWAPNWCEYPVIDTMHYRYCVDVTYDGYCWTTACINPPPPVIAVEEPSSDMGIKVYPNPTNGEVIIRSELEINKIQIINTLGETVLDWNQNQGRQKEVKLDVFNFPSAIYLVKLQIGDRVLWRKIIRE